MSLWLGTAVASPQPTGRFGAAFPPVGSPGVRLHSIASHGDPDVNPAPFTWTWSPVARPSPGVTATVGVVVIGAAKLSNTDARLLLKSPRVSAQP